VQGTTKEGELHPSEAPVTDVKNQYASKRADGLVEDCTAFAGAVAEACESHLTLTRERARKPWVDNDITVARGSLSAMKRWRRATKLPEDTAAANEASQKLADLYTEKAEEYCRQQGTNISDCLGAVAFAESRRLINTLSGRKSRPAGTVAGTAVERKSSLRGHFEGLLVRLTDAPVPHMETVLPPQNIADGEFTIAEVAAASVPFKNGKDAGLDGIQAELIKLPGIAEELTPMLNAI